MRYTADKDIPTTTRTRDIKCAGRNELNLVFPCAAPYGAHCVRDTYNPADCAVMDTRTCSATCTTPTMAWEDLHRMVMESGAGAIK